MKEKLIDYEGFEAYAKGVKDKYAEKKDVITNDERKYLQLMNDGFELIHYGEAETLLQMLVIVECEKIVDKMKPHNSPAFRKLIDLCLAHNGDANKIVKDEKYTKAGFLGLLQEGLANYPQYQVKSHDGQNLKIDDIVRMWKQKSTDTLIWVTKDMLRELQSNYTNDNALSTVSQKFVKQEKGKGLSTNDYTDVEKLKVGQIPENPKYTDTIPDLSEYAKRSELDSKIDKSNITDEIEGNSIDKVVSQRAISDTFNGYSEIFNNYSQILNGKADKEDIPTKLSQLTNDKTFKTESEIQSMIEKASSLKKEVVTSLPTTGKDDVIYLVKDDKGKGNNNYLEYLWLNGKYELIGSTQVDLSGYATKNDLDKKQNVINFGDGIYKDSQGNICAKQYADGSVLDKLTKLEAYKLDINDIEEFTQQELEEAFK